MSARVCARERDVLRAVAREWQHEDDAATASHAASCARCGAVREAAELLRANHIRRVDAARLPQAGAMWWRLERRLRQEHTRRVQRAALALQAVVLAATAGAAAGVLQIASPWLQGFAATIATTWRSGLTLGTAWTGVTSAWALPIALAAAAWLVLLPAALYVGFGDD